MAEDLYSVLLRFHREVALPDVDNRIDSVRGEIGALRGEMLSNFDAVFARFDRLEKEYQVLAAAVARLEARSVTRAEFQQELEQLKARLKDLEQRLAALEADT